MKAIRLSHGVVFVTDGVHTVRLMPSGECGASPVLYQSLERELRCEPEESWEYLTEKEIGAIEDGGYEKILAAFEEIYRVLGR